MPFDTSFMQFLYYPLILVRDLSNYSSERNQVLFQWPNLIAVRLNRNFPFDTKLKLIHNKPNRMKDPNIRLSKNFARHLRNHLEFNK